MTEPTTRHHLIRALGAALHRWSVAAVMGLCLWVAPTLALAADRDPLDVPLRQYGLMLAVALLGGLVSWAAKVRAGTLHAFNLSALIGELATSAFAGLLTFWLCDYIGSPGSLTAALVGIAGHMGTRAIGQFERWAESRFTPPGPPNT